MKGKIALVTGAGSGIGRSIAIAFSEHGAYVIVADIAQEGADETVSIIKDRGGRAEFRPCDVSKADDVKTLIDSIVKDHGRLDYACNNAGIHNPCNEFLPDADESIWDSIIAVNLKGVFLCMKYETKVMLERGCGVIVNIASMSGLLGEPGSYAYVASKHGIMGLTKTAAYEFADKGIRINAVCPAAVDTPGMAKAPPEFRKKYTDSNPMKRMARPEEIAGAVMWLCSDIAGFVTGTGLVIDGGVSTI
ncbi:MAG: glucose 1-dehydrogenase [Deltaproteobacteria bacterium]|nr:glucose 1-dehydrogenase [Deltaproteobacteria bacterium]